MVCPPPRWRIFRWGVTAGPAMLLPLLLRSSLCCPQASVLLTRCVRTLRYDTAKTLHSQAEHLLRRRLPLRFHTQSRGIKTRNRKTRSQEEEWRTRNRTVLTYIAAAGVGMIGLSYAAVPLYRLYCQVSKNKTKHPDVELMFYPPLFLCNPNVCLSGDRAGWHGGGRPWCRSSGDDEAGEGAHHQGHLQRRHTRQYSVELQTATDRDLRKTRFTLNTFSLKFPLTV